MPRWVRAFVVTPALTINRDLSSTNQEAKNAPKHYARPARLLRDKINRNKRTVKTSRARSLLLLIYCTIVFSVKNEHNIYIKVLITFAARNNNSHVQKQSVPYGLSGWYTRWWWWCEWVDVVLIARPSSHAVHAAGVMEFGRVAHVLHAAPAASQAGR